MDYVVHNVNVSIKHTERLIFTDRAADSPPVTKLESVDRIQSLLRCSSFFVFLRIYSLPDYQDTSVVRSVLGFFTLPLTLLTHNNVVANRPACNTSPQSQQKALAALLDYQQDTGAVKAI